MEPITITSLPDEILIAIFKRLCLHCSIHPMKWYPDSWDEHVLTLSSLSLTCRRFGAIAQCVLHHCACPPNITSFLRTIIARPDLAAEIHSFCITDGAYSEPCQQESEIFQAEAQRLAIRDCDEFMQSISDGGAVCYFRLLELAFALLPKVEHLTIRVPFNGEVWAKDLLKAPFAMSSVRRLSLNTWPWESLDPGQFNDFLAMMPCLQTLELDDCKRVSQPLSLAELRSLTIRLSPMCATSLQTLIDSCPKLEHFACIYTMVSSSQTPGGGRQVFTWRQAQQALYSRRKTLKHLDLSSLLYESDLIQPESCLESFRDFEVLETLWVRTIGWGMEWDLDGSDYQIMVPAFPEGVYLNQLLPESLICLGLCGPHGEWEGIEDLADAKDEGDFPTLKTVLVEYDSQTMFDWAKHVLAEAGVVCGFMAPRLYESFPNCVSTEFSPDEMQG